MAEIKTYHGDEVMRAIDQNQGLLFVHFSSPLASACEQVHRDLAALVMHLDLVEVGEVEVPLQELEVIRRYRIEQIPTLVLFNGVTEVERLDDVPSREDLKQFLLDSVSYYVPATGHPGNG
ncbi:MAG: thioredoxin family protein [Planctomycetota bacterium]